MNPSIKALLPHLNNLHVFLARVHDPYEPTINNLIHIANDEKKFIHDLTQTGLFGHMGSLDDNWQKTWEDNIEVRKLIVALGEAMESSGLSDKKMRDVTKELKEKWLPMAEKELKKSSTRKKLKSASQ